MGKLKKLLLVLLGAVLLAVGGTAPAAMLRTCRAVQAASVREEEETEYVLVADGSIIAEGLRPVGFVSVWCKWKTEDGSVTVETAAPYCGEPLEVTTRTGNREGKEYYWGAAVVLRETYEEKMRQK